jgi:hypothetical protein
VPGAVAVIGTFRALAEAIAMRQMAGNRAVTHRDGPGVARATGRTVANRGVLIVPSVSAVRQAGQCADIAHFSNLATGIEITHEIVFAIRRSGERRGNSEARDHETYDSNLKKHGEMDDRVSKTRDEMARDRTLVKNLH